MFNIMVMIMIIIMMMVMMMFVVFLFQFLSWLKKDLFDVNISSTLFILNLSEKFRASTERWADNETEQKLKRAI